MGQFPTLTAIIYKKNNTARLGGVFLDALKGRKGEKEMGIPKLLFGPKVQRRENVGGSLKTLGPLWSNDYSSFDNSKCNTQNAICQVFCQKFFSCIFMAGFYVCFLRQNARKSGDFNNFLRKSILFGYNIIMLENIKIYTSDTYWKGILTDLGANVVDSLNVADVNFDDIKINTPISINDLQNVILERFENKDIIESVFGYDVVLPMLQHKIIVALHNNPNITMRELKDLLGVLPNVSTHAVENAVYQLRKIYGCDIIINKDGKYSIGRI